MAQFLDTLTRVVTVLILLFGAGFFGRYLLLRMRVRSEEGREDKQTLTKQSQFIFESAERRIKQLEDGLTTQGRQYEQASVFFKTLIAQLEARNEVFELKLAHCEDHRAADRETYLKSLAEMRTEVHRMSEERDREREKDRKRIAALERRLEDTDGKLQAALAELAALRPREGPPLGRPDGERP